LQGPPIDRAPGGKEHYSLHAGLNGKVEKSDRGNEVFLYITSNIEIGRLGNSGMNKMECDFRTTQGISKRSAIGEIALAKFGTRARLCEKTGMAERTDSMSGRNKASGEIYAEETAAAQHDKETSV
jgi:hypothetical protein